MQPARSVNKLICYLSSEHIDRDEGLFAQDAYLRYTNSIHRWVKHTEENFMPRANYMINQRHFTVREREIVINWLLMMQVELRLLPETFFITVSIMNRYLSKRRVALEKLQLLGITAMLIASKF